MSITPLTVYALPTLIGWLCMPLLARVLPAAAPDRGLGIARALALLLVGYCAWLLAIVGASHASFWGALILLVIIGVMSWAATYREMWSWLRIHWRIVLAIEATGLLIYLALLLFRGYTADVTTIEKYTNLAIINSISLQPHIPPANAWFGGRPLNYYYFGHWTLATLSQISGLPPNDLTIYGTPILAALCAQSCMTIVLTCAPGRLPWRAWWCAVSILLMLFFGSLNEAVYGIAHWPEEWQRTFFESQIPPPIVDELAPYGNLFEFPAVSLLWGELHAHFLGLPIILVLLALLTHPIMSPTAPSTLPWLGLCALLLGCSWMTNSWQYPPLLLLCLMVIWWRWWSLRPTLPLRTPIWESLVLAIGGMLTILPFLRTFESFAVYPPPDSGLQAVFPGSVIVWSPVGSSLSAVLLSIGLPLILGGAAALWLLPRNGWRWVVVALGVGALAALYRPATLVLLPLIIAGLWLTLTRNQSGAVTFGGMLIALSAMVLLGYEYVMIPDHSLSRSNTIFKFSIQAWLFLAIGAPLLLAVALHQSPPLSHRRAPTLLWLLLIGVLISGSIFPVLRGRQWLRYHGDRWWGLHGLAQVHAYHPDEAAAIVWLQQQPGSGGVLETVDNSSSGTDERLRPARFSSLTGRPAPIGWMGHTAQWNNYPTNAATRELFNNSIALIHSFSKTGSITDVYVLMALHHLDYVAFGHFEAQQWQEAGYNLLAAHLPQRWHSGDVTIFGRPDDFPQALVWLHPIDWGPPEVSTDGHNIPFHWLNEQHGKLSLYSEESSLVHLSFSVINSTAPGQLSLWQTDHRLLTIEVLPYHEQERLLWLHLPPGITTLDLYTTIVPPADEERQVTIAIKPPHLTILPCRELSWHTP